MSTLYRQRVVRADGRAINLVQRRAHLSYCFTGWDQRADPTRATVAVLFYRGHLTIGNLAFIDQLVDELEDCGLNALAIFTSRRRSS